MVNRIGGKRDVSTHRFLVSEPHKKYFELLNKSEVVLVHSKYHHMCSTHFMPLKKAGVFCSWWSPCSQWCKKEHKGCLFKGLLQNVAHGSCQSQNLSTRLVETPSACGQLQRHPASEDYKDGLKSCRSSPKAMNSFILLLDSQCKNSLAVFQLMHHLLNLAGSHLHQDWVSPSERQQNHECFP